jgi:hypothetical protein
LPFGSDSHLNSRHKASGMANDFTQSQIDEKLKGSKAHYKVERESVRNIFWHSRRLPLMTEILSTRRVWDM